MKVDIFSAGAFNLHPLKKEPSDESVQLKEKDKILDEVKHFLHSEASDNVAIGVSQFTLSTLSHGTNCISIGDTTSHSVTKSAAKVSQKGVAIKKRRSRGNK